MQKDFRFIRAKRTGEAIGAGAAAETAEASGKSRLINIDESSSNTAAVKVYNKRLSSKIKIRQCKYISNIAEQDHRFIKWRIQNGLGFKSFESAKRTLSGIEVVNMLRKNRMIGPGISMFKPFCKLEG